MRIPRLLPSAVGTALALTLIAGPVTSVVPAGASPVATDERFVRQAYVDLLNDADPSQAEIDAALAQVTDTGVGQWLADLQRTDEGRAAVVDDLFYDLLRREVDDPSVDGFVNRLAVVGRQKVAADLITSAEYYNGIGGGTNEGWVDAFYRDALGREADAGGRQYFLDELAAGRSRGNIASAVTGGGEARSALVKRFFLTLLDRPVDNASLAFFTDQLTRGSVERVIGIITGSPEYRTKATADQGDEAVIVLTGADELVFTSTGDVAVEDRRLTVTGLPEGASLMGIDVRPSNGVLYSITDGGQVVTIETGAGFATLLGAPIPGFDPSDGVGVDFNPAADALRVVTADQNYRVNATTGVLANMAPDGPLAFAAGDRNDGVTPDASAAAYTNSTRGLPLPASTALYDIDEATNSVVQQVPANDGTLVTKGRLLLDASAVNGFDVSPDGSQAAYALLDAPNAGPSIYKVDVNTGEPKLVSTGAPDGAIGLAVIGDEVVTPDESFVVVSPGVAPTLTTFSPDGDPAVNTRLITGVTLLTDIVGIDQRPKTGQLYAIGSDGQIYSIQISGPTAAATALGDPIAQFDVADGTGFDFNPAADAIRVTNGDRNYRFSLASNTVVGEGTDPGTPGSLQYVAGDVNEGVTPAVTGSAYLNSQINNTQPAATAIFDIDEDLDVVVRQNPANAGNLLTIGDLGVDATAVTGFDASGNLGQNAYALLTVGGSEGLYRIDLGTGEATLLSAPPVSGSSAFSTAGPLADNA